MGRSANIYLKKYNEMSVKIFNHIHTHTHTHIYAGVWGYIPFSGRIYKQLLTIGPLGDFPGGAVVKNPPANAGDVGSIPGLGRSHMLWSS